MGALWLGGIILVWGLSRLCEGVSSDGGSHSSGVPA